MKIIFFESVEISCQRNHKFDYASDERQNLADEYRPKRMIVMEMNGREIYLAAISHNDKINLYPIQWHATEEICFRLFLLLMLFGSNLQSFVSNYVSADIKTVGVLAYYGFATFCVFVHEEMFSNVIFHLFSI